MYALSVQATVSVNSSELKDFDYDLANSALAQLDSSDLTAAEARWLA